MTDLDRKDILERGLASPFWALFRGYVDQEWGAGGQRFESILAKLADAAQDDAVTLGQMRQIAVARREILRLLQWPVEELKRLSHARGDGAPAPTRAIYEALTSMSRRGGL